MVRFFPAAALTSIRALKHRHDARATRHVRAVAAFMREMADGLDPWPDDDWEDDYGCTHCGGEGFREVDDPMWDECDEFGWGPCGSCHGTGQRSRQWVF